MKIEIEVTERELFEIYVGILDRQSQLIRYAYDVDGITRKGFMERADELNKVIKLFKSFID